MNKEEPNGVVYNCNHCNKKVHQVYLSKDKKSFYCEECNELYYEQ